MQTNKQEAISAINSLPDSATIDDIMYRLFVIDKIKKGLDAIDRGESITLDELQKEVASW
jgi:predicted transcriptional regulator